MDNGAGFIISEDGLIFTAHHVIKYEEKGSVVDILCNGKNYKAEVVFTRGNKYDFAILKIMGKKKLKFCYAKIILEPIRSIGDEVYLTGLKNPKLFHHDTVDGKLVEIDCKFQETLNISFLKIKARIGKGMSGGFVWHKKERAIIGFISMMFNDESYVKRKLIDYNIYALALPVSEIYDIILNSQELKLDFKNRILDLISKRKSPVEWDDVSRSLVRITKKEGGTGFIFSPDGYAFTCNHIVENLEEPFLCTYLNNECKAIVRGRYPEMDIAVIKIIGYVTSKRTQLIPFRMKYYKQISLIDNASEFNGINQGDLVYILGRSRESDKRNELLKGSFMKSKVYCKGFTFPLIKIISKYNIGISGGPVWHENSKSIIGVINYKISLNTQNEQGIVFAIPFTFIREMVLRIENGENSPDDSFYLEGIDEHKIKWPTNYDEWFNTDKEATPEFFRGFLHKPHDHGRLFEVDFKGNDIQGKNKTIFALNLDVKLNFTTTIENQRIVMLSGKPGKSKTTTAFYYAIDYKERGWIVQICRDISSKNEKGDYNLDLAKPSHLHYVLNELKGILNNWIFVMKQEKFLLVVEDLHNNAEQKLSYLIEIERILSKLRNKKVLDDYKIILTSRVSTKDFQEQNDIYLFDEETYKFLPRITNLLVEGDNIVAKRALIHNFFIRNGFDLGIKDPRAKRILEDFSENFIILGFACLTVVQRRKPMNYSLEDEDIFLLIWTFLNNELNYITQYELIEPHRRPIILLMLIPLCIASIFERSIFLEKVEEDL